MKRSRRVVGFAATAACLLAVSAVTLAAGSAAYEAAAGAARADHRSAVAGCDRKSDREQRDCLRDADEARETAMIRAPDLSFPPPRKWMLPDLERVPDNLANNASR